MATIRWCAANGLFREREIPTKRPLLPTFSKTSRWVLTLITTTLIMVFLLKYVFYINIKVFIISDDLIVEDDYQMASNGQSLSANRKKVLVITRERPVSKRKVLSLFNAVLPLNLSFGLKFRNLRSLWGPTLLSPQNWVCNTWETALSRSVIYVNSDQSLINAEKKKNYWVVKTAALKVLISY